jgi:hypothetical protein
MFVLLEHRVAVTAGAKSGEAQSGGPRGSSSSAVHWDFLIEIPDQARLAAWRLAENPVGRTEAVAAERIADHRRVYLDYEGPISGDRGSVRRVDRGDSVSHAYTQDRLVAELRGTGLCGVYELVSVDAGQWHFRRARSTPSAQ